MLTPQEVADHAFAKASFGGYNMAMVDEFLDMLTRDYTALYKENTALKSKMKVLADKVEEYRATEDAMRKALMSAQKMADQMVAEAQEQKAAILAAAEKEAKGKIVSLRQETANEQARLAAVQNSTATYLSKLRELYRHEMEYLSSLSKLTPAASKGDSAPRASGETATVEKSARAEQSSAAEDAEEPSGALPEKESLYQELMRTPGRRLSIVPEGAPPTAESASGAEDAQPTRSVDFQHLQFGKDYTIE